MTITQAQHLQWWRENVASGYITGFTVGNLGAINLNHKAVQTSGPLNGQWVTVRPVGKVISSSDVNSGIQKRTSGRKFNPWGLAGKRAPTSYPLHTQTIRYTGHSELVQQYYSALLARVGMTGDLTFTYGLIEGDTYGPKKCQAMLLPVSGASELTLQIGVGALTTIEFSVTWEQTGPFTWT